MHEIFVNCDINKINLLKWEAHNELRIFKGQKKIMNTDCILKRVYLIFRDYYTPET